MGNLKFDITADNQNFIKKYNETNKAIIELGRTADLQSGRIDKVFNSISLKGLERIHELMQGFPKEIQGLESFKKQMADLEKRLEQANKKIIELQNQAKQPITVRTNTNEVAKETFAYDSLLESLNDILGARGQNVAAMLREQNAIKLNQRELKVLEDVENRGLKLSDAQQTRRIQLTNSIMQHKQAISSLQQVVSNEIKLEESAKSSMDEMSQSLGRMRMAYRQLTEEERNSKFGQDLLKNIQGADAQIKQLDATIGNHARNIGDYKQQWNGLQYQMQMVAREMPNFAINPQTGIISLTNNLPYLVDELSKASKAYKDYITAVKAGATDLKAVPSVGKQVLSSLLSWQTGLIMAITLITSYRKEITEWVGGLFKANDGLKEAKRFQDALNQSMRDAVKDSVAETNKLNILYKAATNAKKTIEERTFAVRELKKEFPSYFGLMDDEKIKAGEAAGAYKLLTDSILASAKARRTEKLIVSEQNKYLDYLGETTMAAIELKKAQERADRAKKAMDESFTDYNVQEYKDAFNNLRKIQEEYDNASKKSLQQKINVDKVVDVISPSNLYSDPKKRKEETVQNEAFWTEQKNIAEASLKTIASVQKELMNAGRYEGIPQDVIDQYKQAIKLKSEAEKALKVYEDPSKQDKASDTLRKEQEKLALLMDKQKLDRQRQQQDLNNQVEQSKIDTLDDGFEKEQKQRDLNNKKEIEALKRQKEDYIRAFIQTEKEKFDAKEDVEKANKPKHVKKTFDASTVDTSKQSSSWDKIIKNAETKQGLNEWEQREASMNEYLIKYGTFSQKKEAIDKKYKDAIDQETDLGKINTLQKEWEEATANLDLSKLKQEINWEMVFGDLSKVTKEQLVKIKAQLQEFKKSPEFQNATPEQIQVIEGAINSINNAMVDKGGFFGGMVDSVNELKIATEELKKAEEELAEANKNGTEAEKEEAQKKVNKAKNNKQNAETNVEKSGDETIQHLTDVGNAIAQLGSTAEMSLSSFGNAAGSIVDAFTEAGSKIGGIVGAAFSVLEGIQKQGLDGFVGNVLENVAGAVGGIFDTLTFGAFGLSGADYSGYNEMVSQYEVLNSVWDELIDKKREYIDISYGAEALKSGEEALAIIEKSQDVQRNLAKARATSGASAGSHSIAYRQNKNLGNYASELYKYVAQNGNYNDITNALLGASEEQLKKVAEQMPELWAGLDGNFREHLNNIISGAEQTKDVIAQMKEAVTGISLDEFSSGYIDMLSDLDSTNEDFADNFEKYLQKAIFQSLIANKYKSDIEGLYNSWDELGKDGLTNEEAETLRKKQQELTDNMLAERDKLMNDFGWQSESSSQEATNGGFQTMSQDTGSELNGRFTALQISNEEIKNSMLAMLTGVNLISTTTASNGITLMEIRNVALMSNSYLEDIAGFQKRIITNLDSKLSSIERSTKIMAGS